MVLCYGGWPYLIPKKNFEIQTHTQKGEGKGF